MEQSVKNRKRLRTKRTFRVRKKLRGTVEKPRLSVVKSNKHLYAQLIDDESGRTLASASTISKALKGTEFNQKSSAAGKQLGLIIAEFAKGKKVVFDRGPRKYHGVIAAVADGAREGGVIL